MHKYSKALGNQLSSVVVLIDTEGYKKMAISSLMATIQKGLPSYRALQASITTSLKTNFLGPILPCFFIGMYLPRVTPAINTLHATFHQCSQRTQSKSLNKLVIHVEFEHHCRYLSRTIF